MTQLDKKLEFNHMVRFDRKTGKFLDIRVNCFSLGWMTENSDGYCQELCEELKENLSTWDQIE